MTKLTKSFALCAVVASMITANVDAIAAERQKRITITDLPKNEQTMIINAVRAMSKEQLEAEYIKRLTAAQMLRMIASQTVAAQ